MILVGGGGLFDNRVSTIALAKSLTIFKFFFRACEPGVSSYFVSLVNYNEMCCFTECLPGNILTGKAS